MKNYIRNVCAYNIRNVAGRKKETHGVVKKKGYEKKNPVET